MTESISIDRVLFLQKPDILELQRDQVRSQLAEALPDLTVEFAGAPEDIEPGRHYDAVIAPTLPWLPEALARISGLKWIHFLSAGIEKIWDMPFDKEGLIMTKSSGIHGPQMSEYAIGAMLFFAKRFGRFIEQSRERRWERCWLDELTGKTVMILGLGHVGTMIAERAKVFGMRVIGVQRRPRLSPHADAVVSLADVHDCLDEVDYLVVCLPLTDETRGLVDASFLSRLKRGAYLIDVSRGGVVPESALVSALDGGHLAGAALDVFEREPLAQDSPLWSDPRILVTPHVAGTSPLYMQRAIQRFIACHRQGVHNDTVTQVVDKIARY